MDVDEALMRLGKFNRWRALTYCMVCVSVTVSGCWHMMAIVFIGGEPEHRCQLSAGQVLNDTIPMVLKGKTWRYSQCSKYVNSSSSNATTPCDGGWYYDKTEFRTSIVSDWDLVCDKNYLVETSQSIFNFGVMVGAIVFTTLADRVGRKPVHLGCQYSMLVLGLLIAVAPSYISFVILRFLQGAVREGTGLVGIVMACELFPAAHRTFAGTALELFWAAAWMSLALIAYLIRDWRQLQLAITIPPALTLSFIWLLPESVPWLAANGKVDEAEAILRRAAVSTGVHLPISHLLKRPQKRTFSRLPATRVPVATTIRSPAGSWTTICHCLRRSSPATEPSVCNNTSVAANSLASPIGTIADEEEFETRFTILDLAKSKTMVFNTFVMCSLWFASIVVYYGLSLSTSSLAGDKYVNFFLSGAVEAPAYALTVVVLQKYGRRWPLFCFHMTTGVVLFIKIFIPAETEGGHDTSAIIITLTMIGKFAMTAAFGTVVLYAPEIYPTNLRNFGIGLASVWGRIGGTIAPFFAYLDKTHGWIPTLVFTIVAMVTGVMALLLPETLNRPLPETIEEIESWTRSGVPRGPRLTGDGSAAVDVTGHERDNDDQRSEIDGEKTVTSLL